MRTSDLATLATAVAVMQLKPSQVRLGGRAGRATPRVASSGVDMGLHPVIPPLSIPSAGVAGGPHAALPGPDATPSDPSYSPPSAGMVSGPHAALSGSDASAEPEGTRRAAPGSGTAPSSARSLRCCCCWAGSGEGDTTGSEPGGRGRDILALWSGLICKQ